MGNEKMGMERKERKKERKKERLHVILILMKKSLELKVKNGGLEEWKININIDGLLSIEYYSTVGI